MPNSNSLSFGGLATELDEKSLAQRFAEGDAAAFEAVVALHRPRITRLVYRLLGWPADVDDMVQEVFLAALTKCRRFRGESGLATWLTVIALNKCRSHRRGLLSRWRTLRRVSRRPAPVQSAADAGAMRDDTLAQVREAIKKLGGRDREVIVLHYLEDRGVNEMAGLLKLKQNAVEVRLHRARQRLKKLLAPLIEE
ncbi:MAG TPA: sigma-70 family RNA polymerase sigma factor [Tepidisphaeraceae bacterium]|nr:sigma-70 family RNA polymerase sigma factor [Tepidisphaeraceae bacterium]